MRVEGCGAKVLLEARGERDGAGVGFGGMTVSVG